MQPRILRLRRVSKPDVQIAEAQRRTALGKARGKLALKSPNHPMNLIRKVTRELKTA